MTGQKGPITPEENGLRSGRPSEIMAGNIPGPSELTASTPTKA